MTMAKLSVKLVTPDAALASAAVDQVTAPSVLGEVGILPDHLPLLAELEPGPLGLFGGGGVEYYAVTGGFIEVARNAVTVLADSAERAGDIDVARAQRALRDAEEQLKTLDVASEKYDEQWKRARRARVRLQVAELATAH